MVEERVESQREEGEGEGEEEESVSGRVGEQTLPSCCSSTRLASSLSLCLPSSPYLPLRPPSRESLGPARLLAPLPKQEEGPLALVARACDGGHARNGQLMLYETRDRR